MKKYLVAVLLLIFGASSSSAVFANHYNSDSEMSKEEKKRQKEMEKQQRAAEKAAAKEQERSAKEAEKRQKAAEKAQREQEKAAMKAQKDAEKAEKDAMRAREKETKMVEKRSEAEAREGRAAERRRLSAQKRAEEERVGKWDYLYALPSWPSSSTFFNKDDLITVRGRYQFATKAYSSDGHTQDVSKLEFGEKAIQIQDILLASKLVRQGTLTRPGGSSAGLVGDYYLDYLSSETVRFDGKTHDWRVTFDYARHFNKNVVLGFHLPFAHRIHKLRMDFTITESSASKIAGNDPDADTFPTKYGRNFRNFVLDILEDKGIDFVEENSETGLGNLQVYMHYDINTTILKRLLVGVEAELPTARDIDTGKLWDAHLGNGGFAEVSLFASGMYSGHRLFNPHLLLKGTYSIGSYVDRRVPRRRVYNGIDGQDNAGNVVTPLAAADVEGLEGFVFGNQVEFIADTPFTSVDTVMRGFATEEHRLKVHMGPELNVRVGNLFDQIFTKRTSLDLFYDFRIKGRAYTSSNIDLLKWTPGILTHNSFQEEHRVGASVNYHHDENIRLQVGGLYSFDGRNVPETWELNGAFFYDF